MNRILTLLLLSIVGPSAFAQHYNRTQNRVLDEANGLLEHQQYADAARLYKKLLPVDTSYIEPYYDLGLCYKNLPGQRELGYTLFEKCVAAGHTEAHYELALVRHQQLRFDEAINLFNTYKTIFHRAVPDAEVDRHIAMSRSARQMLLAPVELTIRNMGGMINSKANDYCPVISADGNTLYFTSRREGTTGGLRDPNGQYMEDIYTAKRIDEVWTNATNAGTPLNTITQDATVGLNADGDRMIIYRTSQGLRSGDLYESRKQDGLWQTPELMTDKINSDAQEPSATISPDGNEIYFTSDRPGGFGGRDLYRIRRMPTGEWSLPMNLGPTVNTPYDEDAPFMHSDGVTLFFSSNGHNTMGGFDIFKTVLTDADMNGWSDPENMGYPLNTVKDDIYFCLSEDGQTGYFSSERSGGLGAQDIYQVYFPSSQTDYVIVRGVVTDAGEDPVRARITLTGGDGEGVVGVFNTNQNTGRYIMVVTPGSHYTFSVEAEGFDTAHADLHADVAEGVREIPMDITLVRNEQTARAIGKE